MHKKLYRDAECSQELFLRPEEQASTRRRSWRAYILFLKPRVHGICKGSFRILIKEIKRAVMGFKFL